MIQPRRTLEADAMTALIVLGIILNMMSGAFAGVPEY